jgi:hypothetical protein
MDGAGFDRSQIYVVTQHISELRQAEVGMRRLFCNYADMQWPSGEL